MASFGDTQQMGPGVSAHRQAAELLHQSSPGGTGRWLPPKNRRTLAAEPRLPETQQPLQSRGTSHCGECHPVSRVPQLSQARSAWGKGWARTQDISLVEPHPCWVSKLLPSHQV